jgi:hypothetical protein
MPFAPSAEVVAVYSSYDEMFRCSRSTTGCRGGLPSPFDVRQRVVTELVIGQTAYNLRSPAKGTFSPGTQSALGEFHVDGFSPVFVGFGSTIDGAYRDWVEQVHAAIQDLFTKREFEMTDAELRQWRVISERIDVTVYANNTPLLSRHFGLVVQSRPKPSTVRWENGSKEDVLLEQMPGEFAAYKPGQGFEAVVERDPVTNRLIRVPYVRRAAAPPRLTQVEIEAIWTAMPTTKQLPNTAWD